MKRIILMIFIFLVFITFCQVPKNTVIKNETTYNSNHSTINKVEDIKKSIYKTVKLHLDNLDENIKTEAIIKFKD